MPNIANMFKIALLILLVPILILVIAIFGTFFLITTLTLGLINHFIYKTTKYKGQYKSNKTYKPKHEKGIIIDHE